MKKIIIGILITAVILTVGWFILLRPSNITQKGITESFDLHKNAFNTVAEYLTGNNISAEIDGFLTPDNDYGIVEITENTFQEFTIAVKELTSKDCKSIVSNGESVEFVYHSSGGLFNRLNASIIYNGKDTVDKKITVPLGDGWHLYIYSNNMVTE